MLSLPAGAQVFLCARPVDMRKSFDGLHAIVQQEFDRDMRAGRLFHFLNRRLDRIKLLHWERDGLAIWMKRLETGRVELPRDEGDSGQITLDAAAPDDRDAPATTALDPEGRVARRPTASRVLDAWKPLGRHELHTPATEASGEPTLLHDTLKSVQRRRPQLYDLDPDAYGR